MRLHANGVKAKHFLQHKPDTHSQFVPLKVCDMIHRDLFPTLVCLAILSVPVVADDVPKPDGMSLIYQHDFEDSSLDRYEPTDATAWKLGDVKGNHFASLIRKDSKFEPAVRSPFNRSLI